jgi:hypothetical protein
MGGIGGFPGLGMSLGGGPPVRDDSDERRRRHEEERKRRKDRRPTPPPPHIDFIPIVLPAGTNECRLLPIVPGHEMRVTCSFCPFSCLIRMCLACDNGYNG